MGRFIWQEIVIEDRVGLVTHYGRTGPLASETLSDAQVEVDRTRPVSEVRFGNCCRILEGEAVVASRFVDRETRRVRWS